MPKKKLIVVGGPTASGKTEAAIVVARHFGTEILGADARQVYRELRIGVGRPDESQLASIPHHLIGHVSIHDPYSAGHFVRDSLTLLARLFESHDQVVLAGGTGMYIRALLEGMDDMPSVPAGLLSEWDAIRAAQGLAYLQESLHDLDPAYYAVVDRNNPARLIRAITVSLHTGRPYSSFRSGKTVERDFEPVLLLADLPREVLYPRIHARVVKMLEEGWLEEARALLPFADLKALQTVGYPELFAHLRGEVDWPDTIARIQQATRRYAKRQQTWFRHQGHWQCFDPDDPASLIRIVSQRLKG